MVRGGSAHSVAKVELQLRGHAERVGEPRVHGRRVGRRQLPPPGAARRIQVPLDSHTTVAMYSMLLLHLNLIETIAHAALR